MKSRSVEDCQSNCLHTLDLNQIDCPVSVLSHFWMLLKSLFRALRTNKSDLQKFFLSFLRQGQCLHVGPSLTSKQGVGLWMFLIMAPWISTGSPWSITRPFNSCYTPSSIQRQCLSPHAHAPVDANTFITHPYLWTAPSVKERMGRALDISETRE